MDVRTTTATVAGVPTVSIEGVVDMGSIAVFRDSLLRCIHANAGGAVLVDLDGVAALDDAGLGVLLGAAAAARQAGGDLEIVCTEQRLRTRLRRTRLDRAITVRSAITDSGTTAETTPTTSGTAGTPSSSAQPDQLPNSLAPDRSATTFEARVDEPIFHLALPEDLAEAFASGQYSMSTRAMTLADVGFIHCSTRAQVEATANRFYADLDQLVILTIDPFAVPAVIEWEPPAPGVTELFPHIYGPLPVAAIVMTTFWTRDTDHWVLDS